MMACFLGVFKHRKARKSAVSAISASAVPPNCGFISLDNSQGASKAVAELSRHLDACMNDLDFDGSLSGQRRVLEKRLIAEAGKYENSRLGELFCKRNWPCSQSEARAITVAMTCADAVYEPAQEIQDPEFSFDRKEYVLPSSGGTTKATAFTLVEEASPQTPTDPLFPVLVIAVKGSKNTVDWVVNANSQTRSSSELFDIANLTAVGEMHPKMQIHAGFLHGAKALAPAVLEQIKSQTADGRIGHVLFTGHSAGGAVASLLFARLLSVARQEYPSLLFSCVTFGAPPVTGSNLTPFLTTHQAGSPKRGLAIAIVNEYDPVTRTDSEYVHSLLDLHRSGYALPPAREKHESSKPEQAIGALEKEVKADSNMWKLPKPLMFNVGELVILKDSNPDEDGLNLSAVPVTAEEFSKLLFCKVEAHRRKAYLGTVGQLRAGKFNGKNGW